MEGGKGEEVVDDQVYSENDDDWDQHPISPIVEVAVADTTAADEAVGASSGDSRDGGNSATVDVDDPTVPDNGAASDGFVKTRRRAASVSLQTARARLRSIIQEGAEAAEGGAEGEEEDGDMRRKALLRVER